MVSVARADKARSLVSLARGPAEAEKPQQQTKQTKHKEARQTRADTTKSVTCLNPVAAVGGREAVELSSRISRPSNLSR